MEREHLLTVVVEDALYRSADGRYCVLRASAEAAGTEPIILVGELRDSAIGETLRVRGRYELHGSYGRRLRVASYTPIIPSSAEGIARYLGSGLVPGIGPALARRLVERFGDRTLDVITTQSARLREVPGIGAARAGAIAEAVRGRLDEAELSSFLQSLGLGPALSQRVRQRYGDQTARVVREDPYLAAEQVAGIGFKTADDMAHALGFAHDDPRRAAGAILHLVGLAADQGHSFLSVPELHERARTLDVPGSRLAPALQELATRELVTIDDDAIYSPLLYRAELAVAARLRALAGRKQAASEARRRVEAALAEASYASAQREAVLASFEEGLLVVTGGPGTGKTTTVRAIVSVARAAMRRLLLCAPTGRAAKRLSDASGAEAQTIHRLLEWNPRSGAFTRNRDNPLQADIVLVDEASMLDLQLCQQLLLALPPTAALVLVGDADQLPPIAPGPVLRELLASGICRVVRLREVFRQAQASAIVRAAHAILHGERPIPSQPGAAGQGDLFLVRAQTPEVAQRKLNEVLARVREVYQLDPVRDVQVLSPMRRGPLGSDTLNELLQRTLNPAAGSVRSGERQGFLPGDKVMQLRNDYDRELWNGDVGEVRRVDAGVVFVDFAGREISYEREAERALTLSYACTVHKVQGSEFPAVVMLLHRGHHVLLSRPLLYTALTRARRLAVIIGDDVALGRAISNVAARHSHSRLCERLTRG